MFNNMARKETHSTAEETECSVADNVSQSRRTDMDTVRVGNRPFESPRGRGRNNPGWGRVDGVPFVSPRGRGRRIPLQTPSQDSNTTGNANPSSHLNEHFEQHGHDLGQVQQVTAPDGTSYYSGLIRLDNKPFESPRGRGRNNPGWGRSDGRPFVSQRGHQRRSANSYAPSAPTFDDIMDDDN